MNSSGDRTGFVVPSRRGVFSLSTTCPAALVRTRSLASAGRAMQEMQSGYEATRTLSRRQRALSTGSGTKTAPSQTSPLRSNKA